MNPTLGLFLLPALLLAPACREPEPVPPVGESSGVAPGTSLLVPSTIYGSDQRISVVLPEGYRGGKERYPVVFATHSRFLHLAGTLADLSGNQIPPAILVYLETYSSDDLIPAAVSSRPGSGGADRLASFFAEELIPFIDARFRTRPFRVFHSGSWGGVFCVYTLLSRPEVFQGCIAATPWVIYDQDAPRFVSMMEPLLQGGAFRHNFLFLVLGNDPDPGLREGVEALAEAVDRVHPEGLDFEYRYWPEEDHYSVGHKAFFDGLRWMFRDWTTIPDSVLEDGPASVEAYRAATEERFGYPIGVSWTGTYSRGFELLDAGDTSGAQEMFRVCEALAPAVPACPMGLGRVLERGGDLEGARSAYRRALELAVDGEHPDLAPYQDALARVSGGSG